MCLGADGLDSAWSDVQRGHLQTLPGQIEGVASLAGSELEHAVIPSGRECLGGSERGGAGVGAVHIGVGIEAGGPVCLLSGDGLGVDGLLRWCRGAKSVAGCWR